MILGQLRMGARHAIYAPLPAIYSKHSPSPANFGHKQRGNPIRGFLMNIYNVITQSIFLNGSLQCDYSEYMFVCSS